MYNKVTGCTYVRQYKTQCVCVCVCVCVCADKNTGVDCHSLLQRNFPTQGSNPGLLHHRQILYRLSYREVPKTQCVMWKDGLQRYICKHC